MQQNQQNLDQVDAQKREAMHQESMQALAQLARAQHAADQRQNMSDAVLNGHTDMIAANRDRLVAAQQAAGIPYTNVTHNTHNYDQSTHNGTFTTRLWQCSSTTAPSLVPTCTSTG